MKRIKVGTYKYEKIKNGYMTSDGSGATNCWNEKIKEAKLSGKELNVILEVKK